MGNIPAESQVKIIHKNLEKSARCCNEIVSVCLS